MVTIRKTITLTDNQDKWSNARIASGDFSNDSEYFCSLVRRDQEQNAKLQVLKEAIQEGLGSGISKRTLVEI
jgi:antitoxin ParD1/3/4